eukprot:m.21733 g.21733  ORF g.21733 m.21733 type:complete len:244 (-) comp3661_c0_seq1:296-1027(-)
MFTTYPSYYCGPAWGSYGGQKFLPLMFHSANNGFFPTPQQPLVSFGPAPPCAAPAPPARSSPAMSKSLAPQKANLLLILAEAAEAASSSDELTSAGSPVSVPAAVSCDSVPSRACPLHVFCGPSCPSAARRGPQHAQVVPSIILADAEDTPLYHPPAMATALPCVAVHAQPLMSKLARSAIADPLALPHYARPVVISPAAKARRRPRSVAVPGPRKSAPRPRVVLTPRPLFNEGSASKPAAKA